MMMDISVSDMRNFLRCRRRWDLTSPNRQGIAPLTEAAYFFIGSAFHRCLEEGANLQRSLSDDELQTLLDREVMDSEREAYEFSRGHKMPPIVATEDYAPLITQVKSLVLRYQAHYGENILGADYRYLHTEVVLRIPIPLTYGFWRGTIDGVAEHTSTHELYVVEHKTYSRPPNERDYTFDDQTRMYCWALEEASGERVAGVIYDGMNKKPPTVPRLLQSGAMSRNKGIDTTEATYRQALIDNDLEPEDYEDHLTYLRERDRSPDNPFFKRFLIPMDEGVKEATEEQLRGVYNSMTSDNLRIYPHRPWNGCGDCSVRSICDSMMLGEDLEPIMQDYARAVPYGTFRKTTQSKLDLTWRYDTRTTRDSPQVVS